MIITYSDQKDNLGISVKGLITSMGLKSKLRPKQNKKARYAIINNSMKELSKIIRELENFAYKIYERRRPKSPLGIFCMPTLMYIAEY